MLHTTRWNIGRKFSSFCLVVCVAPPPSLDVLSPPHTFLRNVSDEKWEKENLCIQWMPSSFCLPIFFSSRRKKKKRCLYVIFLSSWDDDKSKRNLHAYTMTNVAVFLILSLIRAMAQEVGTKESFTQGLESAGGARLLLRWILIKFRNGWMLSWHISTF